MKHQKAANASSEVYDLTPFTILDFPDTPACVIWFAKCNLRCHYCYNPHIVNGEGRISNSEILSFLKRRVGLLNGVVLSGGEPTMAKSLISLAKEIKELGFKIKLDTNGTKPEVIEKLLFSQLIDYIALDFKATKENYKKVTDRDFYDDFLKSLKIIQKHGVDYELRTTIHPDLFTIQDIETMARQVKSWGYTKPLYVQQFRFAPTLGNLPDKPKLDLSSLDGIVER